MQQCSSCCFLTVPGCRIAMPAEGSVPWIRARSSLKLSPWRNFAQISTRISGIGTGCSCMCLAFTRCSRQWFLNSKYLLRFLGAGSSAMRTADVLSSNCDVGVVSQVFIEYKRLRSHWMCCIPKVADMYSVSIVDKGTMLWFLEHQKIGVFPKQWILSYMDLGFLELA